MAPMRLVMVEWYDSFGCSTNWEELDESRKPEPMLCKSVGWLFRDGPDCKVIVPHVAEIHNGDRQGCGDMTIPTKSICKIHDLIEVREPPT